VVEIVVSTQLSSGLENMIGWAITAWSSLLARER
jgi:hypothetical protein